MNGKRLIVIGSTGSLGRQLAQNAESSGRTLLRLARRELNGTRRFDCRSDRLADVVPDMGQGDCVYFTFGITDPNQVHADPTAAHRLNVDATVRLLDEVLNLGARAVFISTELVFDGACGGYAEDAPTNPSTEYGRQKVEVERHLFGRDGDWVIVRTGATVTPSLGENCAVEKTYASLLKDRCRMGAGNVFSLTDGLETGASLLALSERGEPGVYHFVGTPPVERVELAEWVRNDSRFGARMYFSVVPYETLPFPEPRPLRSFMIEATTSQRLGVRFSEPRDAVRAKVIQLDASLAEKRG